MGASGFLRSHVTRKLVERGDDGAGGPSERAVVHEREPMYAAPGQPHSGSAIARHCSTVSSIECTSRAWA